MGGTPRQEEVNGQPNAERVPQDLLAPVVAWFNPRRVYLFGSNARGEAGIDSDIDLLVVVDDDTPREKTSWRGVWESRRHYHKAVDIVPCRESAFRDTADICGSIPYIAVREGIVVYDRANG